MFMVIMEEMQTRKKGVFDFHLYETREEAYSLVEELQKAFPSAIVATMKWHIQDTPPREWLTDYYKRNAAYSKMRHADLIPREML